MRKIPQILIKLRDHHYTFLAVAATFSMTWAFAAELQGRTDLDINAKIAQLDIDHSTLKDVIRVFGEPTSYRWGSKKFDKDNLPANYLLLYPGRFSVVMSDDRISELRHERPGDYLFRDRLRVGSSLDEVLEEIGQPEETIEGKPNEFKDGVLYKDIDGKKGFCYYSSTDQHVRLFLLNNKVHAIYVTRSGYDSGKSSTRSVTALSSIKAFDDVRWKDLSKLDLSDSTDTPSTLWFHQKTVWPDAAMLPDECDPKKLLANAKNPGLGVRELHQQGITGKGVNVAIIDQPMYLDHPEFAGKIVAYYDVGCESEGSMHGPAVTSLLVGTNCGTAPDARVYYVAAPSWLKDTAYYAKALDWIVEQNEKLPATKKIRVVSVSAAPSGPGTLFEKGLETWDEACTRAEAANILVLDCTQHQGIIGACWYDSGDPEDVAKCTPGYPGRQFTARPERILVPASPRTTAEEYGKGQYSYQYCGRGGLSWSIPYCSGVLAMGWQLRPDLSPKQMCELLFESAHEAETGAQIINPKEFITRVQKARLP